MGRTNFVFQGLVEIEDRVRRLAPEIAYLAVSDRTDRSHEEQLGRFDFVMRDALPYLARAGLRVVDTASFVCKNVDHDLDLPVPTGSTGLAPEPELRIPTPTFDEGAAVGASRGLRALGDYYAQWGQIVLGSVGQLQGVNNAMTARLHRQLQESRDQVDQLVASILEFRVAELRMADERRSDQRSEDNRTELAKHALQQLGDMAKSLLTARGIPAELADVLGAIGQSPALVTALNEPDVRALRQEPQNLELLAGMLRQAGQQARHIRDAAVDPTRTS